MERDTHEAEDGETDVDPEVGEEPSLDEHRERWEQAAKLEESVCMVRLCKQSTDRSGPPTRHPADLTVRGTATAT